MSRKPRSQRDQRRRGAQFAPKKRLLIVCEGTKTEPLYFIDACNELGINKGLALVDVVPGDGSNPVNVVATAEKRHKAARKLSNAFDEVYCVFDRDEHARFDEAVGRARDLNFEPVISNPCFEYWFLLHFRDHAGGYVRAGRHSPGECCLRNLQAEWPDYAKGQKRVFKELAARLPAAKQRAERRLRDAEADGSHNPTTRVHLLIAALEALNQLEPATA